jgi:protein SCO1/2
VRRALRPLLIFAVVLVACGTAQAPAATSPPQTRPLRGLPVLDPVAADFALRDQNGSVVRLSAERGKVVLLTFLYTNCPDVCPLIAAKLGAVLHELPRAQRADTRVLAVSVDPAHDTRAAVRRFVTAHRLPSQFHYLTGGTDELKPIWQSYNLLVEARSVELVSHPAYVLLIDLRGKARLYYSSHAAVADMLHDVRRLLTPA